MKNNVSRAFTLLLLCFSLACGKSTPLPDSPKPPTPVPLPTPTVPAPSPSPPTTDPVASRKFLPTQFASAARTIDITYVSNSNRIASITDNKGYDVNITYKDDRILSIKRPGKNMSYASDFYRDEAHRVMRVSQYSVVGAVVTPGEEYQFTYNDKQQVREIQYFTSRKKLTAIKTFSYDAEGNISQIKTDDGQVRTYDFTYDHHNGIARYVAESALLCIDLENDLFSALFNNVVTKGTGTASPVTTYNYTYNADNYPTEASFADNGVTTRYRVRYKPYD